MLILAKQPIFEWSVAGLPEKGEDFQEPFYEKVCWKFSLQSAGEFNRISQLILYIDTAQGGANAEPSGAVCHNATAEKIIPSH